LYYSWKITKYDVLNTLIDAVKKNPAITHPELFKKRYLIEKRLPVPVSGAVLPFLMSVWRK
jgi:hypothetical protein